MTNKALLFFLFFSMFVFYDSKAQEHSFVPKDGFVPDKDTASLLGELVLKKIYGDNNIDRQKPFKIFLKDNIWTVIGTLSKEEDKEEALGGVFMIKISKKDARIIRVTHGR